MNDAKAKQPNDPSSPTPPTEASHCNRDAQAAFGAAPLLGDVFYIKLTDQKYPNNYRLYQKGKLYHEGPKKISIWSWPSLKSKLFGRVESLNHGGICAERPTLCMSLHQLKQRFPLCAEQQATQ